MIDTLHRNLELYEIEFRVQSVKDKGAIILAYKTARTDMNILDEAGVKWQSDFKSIDGKLFAGIGVFDTEVGWLWKWDTGVESKQDAQKGEASDAFKRAGFKWGIGRHLYDFPFIWANKSGANDKFYDLKEWDWGIEYDAHGGVFKLAAKDKTGKVRYNYRNSEKIPHKKTVEAVKAIDDAHDFRNLIETIGLANSKEQVFELVERANGDPTEPTIAAAIEAKLKTLK